MGHFKIEIFAIGGHGQDRGKKDGEEVYFFEGGRNSPDAIAKTCVNELQKAGIYFGFDSYARIIHWPGQPTEVIDNLVTGIRTGNF